MNANDSSPTFDPRDLLTYEEAAAYLGGSRRLIEDAVRRGDLVRVYLGNRCVRVTKKSLAAFQAARTQRAV